MLCAKASQSAVTPLVIQHRHLADLRQENQSLREQAEQAGLQGEEIARLSAQLADARRSRKLSEAQFSELLRLRGEVDPLRRDSQKLARLRGQQRAESQTPPATRPPEPPDYRAANSWANVGVETPEASIQTFFWAGRHGGTNLIGNLLRWQRDGQFPDSDKLDQTFARGMVRGATRLGGSMQGFRVASQQEAGDEVLLDVELTDQDGEARSHTLRLVREGDQWFPVMHVWLAGPGSVQAALDVPEAFQQRK